MNNRSIVYVDGFNLYYGSVRGTRHKWLDLEILFERLRPHDDIQAIRYFTALVDGKTQKDQLTYLGALQTLPKLDVILGKFKYKQFKCRVTSCSHQGTRFYTGTEEKKTDVAIAISLLDDAYQDLADRFVVVSGDSDLVPAVNTLKDRFPEKQVIVYVPSRNRTRGAAGELRSSADKDRTLPMALVKRCQFPTSVIDGNGSEIVKPPDW